MRWFAFKPLNHHAPWSEAEDRKLLQLVERAQQRRKLDWWAIAKKLGRSYLATQNRYYLVRSFERRQRP